MSPSTESLASTPNPRPDQLPEWTALAKLAAQGLPHLRTLLNDPQHGAAWQFQAPGLQLDASRQRVNPLVRQALLNLAQARGVLSQAQAMARGEQVNPTEGRAALHLALRGSHQAEAPKPWGPVIESEVKQALNACLALADALRSGQVFGHTQARITDVVNLGIGGSDLGPRMACHALLETDPAPVKVHFLSNPDAWAMQRTLATLTPERTLFIVQSKSFTTQETLTQWASAKRWLIDHGCPEASWHRHAVAVTAKPELALAAGFDPARILSFWDWVGGRYSVWSAIGLPVAITTGSKAFLQFLQGAADLDQHFLTAPPERNLPLWLALLGVWNLNFMGMNTHHVAPYAYQLLGLTPHLQQLDMESNGKSTHTQGQRVQLQTAPIVWGGQGIDGQHAYFQLMHQGTHRIAVDFLGVRHSGCPLPLADDHQALMHRNLLAQANALALGRDADHTRAQLQAEGLSPERIEAMTPHRSFEGNTPSNLLWLEQVTPYALGALLAAYEHKVFSQAVLWDIHPFDQWGVELGKTMAAQGTHANR
jgi:glucose-6-phosphate isomerase